MTAILNHNSFIGKLLEIGQGLNQRMGLLHMRGHVHRVTFPYSSTAIRRSEAAGKQWLENIVAEILALDNLFQALRDILPIDRHTFVGPVWRRKREVIEQTFQNGVQPSGTNIFRLLVHAFSD